MRAQLPDPVDDRSTARPRRGQALPRALALYRPGAGGKAVLSEARRLAGAGMSVTFATLVPFADPMRCCGPGASAYNQAMREEASQELAEARRALCDAQDASFLMLSERDDPPLAEWVQGRQFEVILLPGGRFSMSARRLRRQLRHRTAAEIRIVRPG